MINLAKNRSCISSALEGKGHRFWKHVVKILEIPFKCRGDYMYFYTHTRSGKLRIDVVTKISFGKGTICNTFCKINQNCWCCVASVQSGSSPPPPTKNCFLRPCHALTVVSDMYLFRQFCMAMYGCPLWDLTSRYINKFYTVWRKAVRQIWKIPNNTHCDYLPHICVIHCQLKYRLLKDSVNVYT